MRRRTWLKTGAFALAGCSLKAAETEGETVFTGMGIASSPEHAAALKRAGASFLTLSTDAFLVPGKDDAAFAKQLASIQGAPLPVLAC